MGITRFIHTIYKSFHNSFFVFFGLGMEKRFDRVDEWKDCVTKEDWFVIDVRDGEKRPLVMWLVQYRVLAHTQSGTSGSGEPELLIIVERPDGNGLKYDYYLSNALDAP